VTPKILEKMSGKDIDESQLELENLMKEKAIRNIASALHYLVIHANIKQYYYEVKYIRNDARLMDVVGRGLKELDMLKKSEEYQDINQLMLPSTDDLVKMLESYGRFKERFIAALTAMIVASCKLCWTQKTQ
jgi:thiamine biosynthesis protein ThiC